MDLVLNRTYTDGSDGLEIIRRLPDKHYLYKYDFREEPDKQREDGTTEKCYSYVPVLLKGYPNLNEVIKYLLRQVISLENELKMINDLNEIKMLDEGNINESPEYEVYTRYLELRREIKHKVRDDFNNA